MQRITFKRTIVGPIEPLPVSEQDRLYKIMCEQLEAQILDAFGFGLAPAQLETRPCDRPCSIVHHPGCRNATN